MLLLCLGILLGAAGVARAADSPQAALVQAQRGIDEANSDLFNAVVDVASVVDRAADALIDLLKEQVVDGTEGTLAGEILGGNIAILLALAASPEGSAQVALLRSFLNTEVKNFVAVSINSGYLAGKPDSSVSVSRGSLTGILRIMPAGRREIVPGKSLVRQDGKARMSAFFNDPEAGSLPLELVFEKHKDGWRVMEIANVKELLHEVAKRKRK